MNAIPVFEAKNKLPLYIHLSETQGPIPISRRNEEVAYIVSKEDFLEMQNQKKEKSIVDLLQERRKEYGLEDDDFDYTEYFDSIRMRGYPGRESAKHLFDEV